jgi:hypothetical protein
MLGISSVVVTLFAHVGAALRNYCYLIPTHPRHVLSALSAVAPREKVSHSLRFFHSHSLTKLKANFHPTSNQYDKGDSVRHQPSDENKRLLPTRVMAGHSKVLKVKQSK